MAWMDRVEQCARTALWLSLTAAVYLGPVKYFNQRSEEARQVEAARKEDQARSIQLAKAAADAAKAAEDAAKPVWRPLSAYGSSFSALNENTAIGRVYVSNGSGQSSTLCIRGVVSNPSQSGTSLSLTSCKVMPPYASNVEIQLMFASGDLSRLCKTGSCSMMVVDAPPEPTPPPTASP